MKFEEAVYWVLREKNLRSCSEGAEGAFRERERERERERDQKKKLKVGCRLDSRERDFPLIRPDLLVSACTLTTLRRLEIPNKDIFLRSERRKEAASAREILREIEGSPEGEEDALGAG